MSDQLLFRKANYEGSSSLKLDELFNSKSIAIVDSLRIRGNV